MASEVAGDQRILANLVARRAYEDPDLDVLTFVDVEPDGRLSTELRSYGQLWDNGRRVAAALLAAGMQAGQRFALLMHNHPEFVEAMVGSAIAATVFVPLDARMRGEKLAFMLGFAQCQGVICADYAVQNLRPLLGSLPELRWVWVMRTGVRAELPQAGCDVHWLADVLPAVIPQMRVAVTEPDSTMQMLFSSGTTGDPKAILASYSRYYGVATIGALLGWNDDERPYTGLSLTHANAQLITLGNTLYGGLRGVISRRFTKSRLWDICREFGCTTFNLLGGMTTAIYGEPARADDPDNPVRFVLSAGMPIAIWEDFARRFNVQIFEFYAAAEGGMTLNPPGQGPVGSIGKPPPSLEARIVDENDRECPPGVQGEIVFRNADGSCPQVTYFGDPQASSSKTNEGWLRMGDVGHRDAAGWFYFDYRKGGALRHNGTFVNTGFVEKAIAEHASVSDVFVYGVDALSAAPGERDVVAAVVPEPGETFIADDLFRHCLDTLERDCVPTYIQVMDEIPKTASEKPQERICLAHFQAHPELIFRRQPSAGRAGDVS